MVERDWHVLLVGGPSGSGKSMACAELMRRYGIGCAEIDDISTAVKAMTTPEQQPVLHYWAQHAQTEEWTAQRILELTISVADALAQAVEAVVAAHLDYGPPVIMEGDYLLPALAARLGERVRMAFIHEPDEAQLVANYAGREPASGQQLMRARVSYLFGQWLLESGRTFGVPVLPARPWDTLPDRIARACST